MIFVPQSLPRETAGEPGRRPSWQQRLPAARFAPPHPPGRLPVEGRDPRPGADVHRKLLPKRRDKVPPGQPGRARRPPR